MALNEYEKVMLQMIMQLLQKQNRILDHMDGTIKKAEHNLKKFSTPCDCEECVYLEREMAAGNYKARP